MLGLIRKIKNKRLMKSWTITSLNKIENKDSLSCKINMILTELKQVCLKIQLLTNQLR
jgi:hypothetical protein